MTTSLNIFAIGGGGFTHDCDTELEDYLRTLATHPRPNIGFIPTASRDSDLKIKRFYKRFEALDCGTSHLSLFGSVDDLEHWILSQHILYVGGGNTKIMLEVWREWGLPQLLLEAARAGTVLSGVSAGAVCWFDYALSDSGGNGLMALPALGFTAGSCCPHYSTEPARKKAFEQQIQSAQLPDGIAIDDGVGVHIRDGAIVNVIKARGNASAYRVTNRGSCSQTEALA